MGEFWLKLETLRNDFQIAAIEMRFAAYQADRQDIYRLIDAADRSEEIVKRLYEIETNCLNLSEARTGEDPPLESKDDPEASERERADLIAQVNQLLGQWVSELEPSPIFDLRDDSLLGLAGPSGVIVVRAPESAPIVIN